MPELIPVLDKEKISSMITDVAKRISDDYQGKELILIGILKGSFIFMSDLVQKLSIPVKIDFLGISSYGNGMNTSGTVQMTRPIGIDLQNKDVLIVEDIVDTGLSMTFIMEHLQSYQPKSIKLCTMIDKKERREADIAVDYSCHETDEGFLVGYGLDYAEDYRYLPGIYHLKL